MPNSDEIYASGGAYLKGEDFKDCDDITMTISGVEIKQFEDGKRKAVLSFNENDRRLVVNFTNKAMICEVAGSPETDEWIGKEITLYGTKDSYGGKVYDVIRVRPPERKTGKKPKFLAKDDFEDKDNEVPF